MREKKEIFRNISYSTASNLFAILTSIILILVIPKLLNGTEYGYWQLYLLYASYVGIFHFGWCDGIYLRYGGTDYGDLDKNNLNIQFWMLTLLELAVLSVFFITAVFGAFQINKKIIIISIGVNILLMIPRNMLQFVLYGCGRIKEEAGNAILEKIIYLIAVFLVVKMEKGHFYYLIFADLTAKAISLLRLIFICRDIVWNKPIYQVGILQDIVKNIKSGSKVLIGNITNTFANTLLRLAIEWCWTIEVFGKVSLALTLANLLTTFVHSVSISIFPFMKQTCENELAGYYKKIYQILFISVCGSWILYYPLKIILTAWLPQYTASIESIAVLFPISLFDAKMTMLTATYLKALRMEKQFLAINFFTVLCSGMFAFLFIFKWQSLGLAVVSFLLLSIIRSIMGDLIICKRLEISTKSIFALELIISTLFVYFNQVIGGWKGSILYALLFGEVLLIILYSNKRQHIV